MAPIGSWMYVMHINSYKHVKNKCNDFSKKNKGCLKSHHPMTHNSFKKLEIEVWAAEPSPPQHPICT